MNTMDDQSDTTGTKHTYRFENESEQTISDVGDTGRQRL
jgi:hypothetical protein